MSNRKLVLEIHPMGCGEMMSRYGQVVYDPRILNHEPKSVCLAIFTGGSDVHPSMYGEQKGSRTYPSLDRDEEEKAVFEQLKELNIPMFGICRGLQFLNVMAGNSLVQHVNNHAGQDHQIEIIDGRKIIVNSAHHQMINPKNNGIVLARSIGISSCHLDGNDNEIVDLMGEIEAAYFPDIKAAGVQHHPEWLKKGTQAVEFAYEIIDTFLIPGGPKENINLRIASGL